MMPQSHVRLSAGRSRMNEQMQALCFLSGANSIFYGDKLLTTENPEADADMLLFAKLGINPEQRHDVSDEAHEAALADAIKEQNTPSLFHSAV
jgi:biotin synthase